MDTDRNLLFGVLALQADLLDNERFAEACSAWAARKDTPLAELLVQRGWLTPADRADVEKLLARKLARHNGDARAGLAELTTDELRHCLASVADEAVQQSLLGDRPTVTATTSAYQPQGRGRYQLTRLHASGGIGQVWLARDSDLGREVVLKELRPERQDHPAAQTRFLAEACITGQLEHPGIADPARVAGHLGDHHMIQGGVVGVGLEDDGGSPLAPRPCGMGNPPQDDVSSFHGHDASSMAMSSSSMASTSAARASLSSSVHGLAS